MEITINSNKSNYVIDDYFALIAIFNIEKAAKSHSKYIMGDSNVLEISCSENTGELFEIRLLLAEIFSLEKTFLPQFQVSSKKTFIKTAEKNKCDVFNAKIYKDGIVITLSSEKQYDMFICGNVIFCITQDNELSKVIFTNMPPEAISNAKEVLEWEQKCRNEQANK